MMMFTQRTAVVVSLSWALLTGWAGAANAQEKIKPVPDPIFDVEKLIATPVDAKITKGPTEKDGVMLEELMYHSEMDGDKRVDIYALFAYPKGARKLPAIVWCMPGLGQANDYWPIFFAKRGYAALCPEYPHTGYRCTVGYTIDMQPASEAKTPEEIRKTGIYHAAVAFLKGVSFLQTRPEVDKDRIGVAGSSWGGFFTTLMVGVDPRLKAGASFFGCGNLQTGSAWWKNGPDSMRSKEACENWRTTLDPAFRLAGRTTPIGWFTGANDVFFWMPALMQTWATAAGPRALCIEPNWNHAMSEQGDGASFEWLDAHLKGAPAFPAVSPVEIRKDAKPVTASWKFTGPRKAVSAELIWSLGDDGNWVGRGWMTLPAVIKGDTCTVELPKATMPYYIGGAIFDDQKLRYSTLLVRIDPKSLGLADGDAGLKDFDGCLMWGSFEAPQINYLQRCGLFTPETAADAKEGKQAAVLKGNGQLPVFFVPGALHAFTAFLKVPAKGADVEVEMAVTGGAECKQKLTVKAEWTEIRLEVVAPSQGDMTVSFTVPAGASVLLDDAHFRLVKMP
jgi:dienelactone hydrolase